MTRRSRATARKRDALWARNPPSPFGLGRHGADHASRGAPVVGAPRRSYSYAFGAPPRMWPRGAPNATRPTSSTGL